MANTLGENIKQLFRRFSDGALVAKNDSYDVVDGHQHIQYIPSHVWSIDHAKGSTSFSVNVFIDDELVKCDVEIVDDCNVMLIFSEEVSGYANLLFLIDPNAVNNCAPAPSLTPTPTITPSITVTPSLTPSVTPSITASVTPTISLTPSVTASLSLTASPTITVSPSATSGVSPTPTPTPSVTNSVTPTVSVTGTPSATVTPTLTLTQTPGVSVSPTVTFTPTVTTTASLTPTISLSPTVTYTPSPTSSFTPTPTITLTQHDCKFDGSSLTGWVNVGAEMIADPTDSSKQVIGVPEHSYAYINCNQPFDISTQINVDVYMNGTSAVVDLLLGCNSTGAGVMVRFDSRNYPSGGNDARYYCGFLQSSTWTNWDGDPTNGYTYAFPPAGWHSVNVRVNQLSDAGLVLDMYVDGVFACRSVPLTQYGNYIGFNGDQNNGSYGYLRNFAITRDIFITPTPTPTTTRTPTLTTTVTPTISVTPSVTSTISVTPSVTATISITPTHSTTPTPTPSTGWTAFAHRYWRMNITSNNGSGSYVAVTELAFYNDDASAVSLVNSSLAATNYLESSEANSDNNGHYAFDGNNTTKWTAGAPTGYIGWDFGTAQMVKTVSVIGNYIGGDQPTLAPKDFTIQYSDDGSSWTTAATITNQLNWNAGEKRLFTLDAFQPTPTPTPSITITPSVTLSNTVTPTIAASPTPSVTKTIAVTPSVTTSAIASTGPLLHFDGATGSTTITDAHSATTWTRTAPAQLSTAQAKFGTASLFVNGGYVSTTNMGAALTGNFCIEGWANTTDASSTRGIFQLALTNSADNLGLGWDTAGLTWQLYNDATVSNSSTTTIPTGWFHWAVYRSSGTLVLAINGNPVITLTGNSSNFSNLKTLTVGAYYNGGYPWVGYLDEVRVTLASSPYSTSGFTPPTSAFT